MAAIFNFVSGHVIKIGNEWRDGRPQVAMQHNYHIFWLMCRTRSCWCYAYRARLLDQS